MTFTYYKHNILCTVNRGNPQWERQYTVIRYTDVPEYPIKGDVEVISTEMIESNDQCIKLDGWTVILFGKMYGISEEHTGTYVIPKYEWEEFAKNYDDSLLNAVQPFDWDEHDWLENDGNEYVVLDFGGQLLLPDEDGYMRPIDEDEDLPEILNNVPINYDLSDVGNG